MSLLFISITMRPRRGDEPRSPRWIPAIHCDLRLKVTENVDEGIALPKHVGAVVDIVVGNLKGRSTDSLRLPVRVLNWTYDDRISPSMRF